MISHVPLDNVKVLSVTTLGAPHQGTEAELGLSCSVSNNI